MLMKLTLLTVNIYMYALRIHINLYEAYIIYYQHIYVLRTLLYANWTLSLFYITLPLINAKMTERQRLDNNLFSVKDLASKARQGFYDNAIV